MKIAIDIDDTIAEFQKNFLKYNNEKYGTDLLVKDVTNYRYDIVFGEPIAEMVKRVLEFYDTEGFAVMDPMAHSQRVLRTWQDTHELYLITARPLETTEMTLSWVKKHFPKHFQEIIFTGQFGTIKNEVKKTKGELCIELGIALMIEDAPTHSLEVAEKGIDTIIIDAPWNREATHDKLTRVKDWLEIEKLLLNK